MNDAALTARSVIAARRRDPLFLLGVLAAAAGAMHIGCLVLSPVLV